jgi:hypothetical protein
MPKYAFFSLLCIFLSFHFPVELLFIGKYIYEFPWRTLVKKAARVVKFLWRLSIQNFQLLNIYKNAKIKSHLLIINTGDPAKRDL